MKEFTGRHMLFVTLGAFGVIITVNLIMASLALSTFPGLTVKNSYVASQDYNGLLAAAKARAALEWRAEISFGSAKLALNVSDKSGQPIENLDVQGRAGRPASQREDRPLDLTETSPGHYEMPLGLAAGRWQIRLHGRNTADQLVVAISEDIWVAGK